MKLNNLSTEKIEPNNLKIFGINWNYTVKKNNEFDCLGFFINQSLPIPVWFHYKVELISKYDNSKTIVREGTKLFMKEDK